MTEYAKLVGLFVALVAGGVGVPIPEDITLIGAGVLADQHLVRLRDVGIVGLAGIMAADWIVYLLGRRYGAAIVARPWLGRVLGSNRIAAVRAAVLQHGAKAVFFARFMFGFRIATFLSAGTFGVSAPRFAIAEASAAVIFVPAMITLGYLFAHQAVRVAENVSRTERWLVLAGLLGLALFIVVRARAARTLTGAAPTGDLDGQTCHDAEGGRRSPHT